MPFQSEYFLGCQHIDIQKFAAGLKETGLNAADTGNVRRKPSDRKQGGLITYVSILNLLIPSHPGSGLRGIIHPDTMVI